MLRKKKITPPLHYPKHCPYSSNQKSSWTQVCSNKSEPLKNLSVNVFRSFCRIYSKTHDSYKPPALGHYLVPNLSNSCNSILMPESSTLFWSWNSQGRRASRLTLIVGQPGKWSQECSAGNGRSMRSVCSLFISCAAENWRDFFQLRRISSARSCR